MNIQLKELLNKEFLSIEEFEILEQSPEVDEIQFNGWYHIDRQWYTILLKDGAELEEYEIFVCR